MIFDLLIDPVANENICLALFSIKTVGAENKLLPVHREHGKTVEGIVIRDAFKGCAVNID